MIKDININSKYVYLISDIHSNINLFKKIINDIKLTKEDYLFILGDVIEKDIHNIETLDYLMYLKNNYNVYFILGNCDNVINEFHSPCNIERLKKYSLILKNTILNEFLNGIGIDINSNYDLNKALDIIDVKYKKYYDFINSFELGYTINNKVLLLHADLFESKKKNLLSEEFINNLKLKELNVCGHLPVMLFSNNLDNITTTPSIYNNFLYIDGGNNVVPFGSINLIKLNLNNLSYTYKSYNNFDKYIVISKQEQSLGTYNALKTKFERFEIIDDLVKYYKDFEIFYGAKSHLVIDNNQIYGYDTLNIFDELNVNDIVLVTNYSKEVSIIIHNNKVSLIDSKKIKKL